MEIKVPNFNLSQLLGYMQLASTAAAQFQLSEAGTKFWWLISSFKPRCHLAIWQLARPVALLLPRFFDQSFQTLLQSSQFCLTHPPSCGHLYIYHPYILFSLYCSIYFITRYVTYISALLLYVTLRINGLRGCMRCFCFGLSFMLIRRLFNCIYVL